MSSHDPYRPGHAATPEEIAAQQATAPTLPAIVHQTSGKQWPQWVNEHRLAAALVAGFAATHIADMIGYWIRMFGFDITPLDFAGFNGLITGTNLKGDTQWLVGYLFHTMNGMVFALGYALLVFPRMGKTLSTGRNVARSLPMGLVLATLSLLWWMPGNLPRVGMDPGFFSHGFGWETIVAVYFWHIAWSLGLGFFFNPQD